MALTGGVAIWLGVVGSASGAARYTRAGAPRQAPTLGVHAGDSASRWLSQGRLGGLGRASAAAATTSDSSYAGTTDQDSPIVLGLSKSRSRVVKMGAFWTAPCDSGGSYTQGGTIPVYASPPATAPSGQGFLVGGHLHRNHGFLANGVGFYDAGGGYTAVVSDSVAGTLGRRSGAGTYQAQVLITDSAGKIVDRCDTGRLRWSAPAPQSLYYGGATTQSQPTVVQLSRSRRSVKRLRLVWFADCSDGGSVGLSDVLDTFPLSGSGHFGDTFTDTMPTSDGGQARIDYQISGKVSQSKASGTFQATVTEMDQNGVTTGTCTSPNLGWSTHQ